MGFWFFGKTNGSQNVALIDVGAKSVAGAYALYQSGKPPKVVYARRVSVEFREGEVREKAVLRALAALSDGLIKEGAPTLLRASGRGSVDAILVLIDAPWQHTTVRTEYLDEKRSFVFTKHLVSAVLEKTRVRPPGKVLVDESVVGTILNGYETLDPFGKEAHRAEIVIMTSLIEESVASAIMTTLKRAFHTRKIYPIAGSSLRYQVMRRLFPHEHDALLFDVTSALTSISFVRHGLLMAIVQIEDLLTTVDGWLARVRTELEELAREFPLPRTIFLLARDTPPETIQAALTSQALGDLWLSENPPSVVAIQSSHLSSFVEQATVDTPDPILFLLAIYWPIHDL